MQRARIRHRRGRAGAEGHALLALGGGLSHIVVMGPVAAVQQAGNIRADMLMEIQPLSVLIDEVRTVTLPQNVGVGMLLRGQSG